MKSIALAAVMASSLGAISAHASDNGDMQRFFANDRAQAAAAASRADQPVAKQQAIAKQQAQSARKTTQSVSTRKRSVVREQAKAAPEKAARSASVKQEHAPARRTLVAEKPAQGRADGKVRGKALGYDGTSRDRYRAMIADHAAANGIPFALGDAVVRVESRYQPNASNRGALGLMQIKHATARGMGYSGSARGLMDPETNIKYGMKYLAQAYRLADGDTCGTVMRYQSGHYAKRVSRANLAYCAKVRTIVASLGTEVASAAPAGANNRTSVE